MPDARAAVCAEGAAEAPAAVGRPGPEFRRAARYPQPRARHLQRHAEGRGRLLLAFPAVADIERDRLAGALVAQRAALASAGPDRHRSSASTASASSASVAK